MDWIGHKVCSGSNLCLPFGRVGTLVGKERTLSFAFADGFRLPKTMAVQVRHSTGFTFVSRRFRGEFMLQRAQPHCMGFVAHLHPKNDKRSLHPSLGQHNTSINHTTVTMEKCGLVLAAFNNCKAARNMLRHKPR